MKKILFLLLCTVSIYGQTSTGQEQEFDYGIKNNSAQTITTPPYLTTTGMDGTQGKIPSALIEKTDNKQNSLTVDGTGTKYPTVDAVFDALALKADIGSAFTAGRVPYTSSASTLSDSSKLLWNNTNSSLEVNGNAPRLTLKNNLNNFSTYFTNDAYGDLYLKNHQDKTLAVFSNPVNSTEQPQMAIGKVSSIPVEAQLYVYGGMNGANIDARGSIDRDEANIDLEGNDWETSPNSLGFSYFGSNSTAFGTMLGYAKNKLGVIRFQDTNYSIINSEKVAGVSPIRFGINNIEIGNVNDKGFSYQSDFSSENISNPRWLADKGYVDTKAPVSGSANYIQNQNASAQSANMWISGDVKARAGAFSSYVDVLGTVSGGNNFIANTGGLYFNGYNNYNAGIFSNTSGTGLSFQTGGDIALSLAPSGAATFSSTISATSYTGSATLTGTPTAPTAAPGTTGNQIATLDYVLANSGSTSGNYTPTYTATENISSITHQHAKYTVVGKIVTIDIIANVFLTVTTNASLLRFTLPVSLPIKSGEKGVFSGNIVGVTGPLVSPATSLNSYVSSVDIAFRSPTGSNTMVTLSGILRYEIN